MARSDKKPELVSLKNLLRNESDYTGKDIYLYGIRTSKFLKRDDKTLFGLGFTPDFNQFIELDTVVIPSAKIMQTELILDQIHTHSKLLDDDAGIYPLEENTPVVLGKGAKSRTVNNLEGKEGKVQEYHFTGINAGYYHIKGIAHPMHTSLRIHADFVLPRGEFNPTGVLLGTYETNKQEDQLGRFTIREIILKEQTYKLWK